MPITPQELISNLGDLPPLPQVATQLLRLTADPDASAEDLRRVISTDQALTGQILKIANSAMFGMVREVTTLTQAIMTLGFSTNKSVVFASSAKNLYHRGTVGLQERLIWEHALVAAIASRAFAKALRFPRVEEAFIGGLLHDIGKSVMGVKFPERYSALLRTVYNERGDGLALELDTFGFDHAMVGEALVQKWNLAPSLQQAARWHHDPIHAQDDHLPLAAIVALANRLALEQKAGIGDPIHLESASLQAMDILHLGPEALESHQEAVRAAIEQDKTMIAEF
ncbi:MAG: HDOD domain-containing protein [Acidobacteriota bacterium]|nr:HDOD domain-containing protein [Acidobacteriota bacterium]